MAITYEIIGNRNPVILLKNSNNKFFKIQTIGDPHLGKLFRNGVPRNRLGDREKLVFESFNRLLSLDSDYTIILGDLFDKIQINNETLNKTASSIVSAAVKYPSRKFVILSGNHDLSKDTSRISSFKLLESYFSSSPCDNVSFITQHCDPILIPEFRTLLYFSHYNPFKSLDEEISTLNLRNSFNYADLKIAFGHWDTIDYDSNKYINRKIPSVILNEFDLIVTGHEHKPTTKQVEGKLVLISGSMQPYAFSEEIRQDGLLYLNMEAEEVLRVLDENPNYFVNSVVRIHYDPAKELIPPFNCLSCSYKIKEQTPVESNMDSIVTNTNLSFKDMFLELVDQSKTESNGEYITKVRKAVMERSYDEGS